MPIEAKTIDTRTLFGYTIDRYVVAMDKLAIGNDEGIAFVHIADFLLMDKW